MKKVLLSLTIITIALLNSGCATWDGIKSDSSNAYDSTKDAIHDATK
jgi:hypothetical protein